MTVNYNIADIEFKHQSYYNVIKLTLKDVVKPTPAFKRAMGIT